MTKLETVERDLQADIDREVQSIQIAARWLAKRFTEIANSDHIEKAAFWDLDPHDLPRDAGMIVYKMGQVAGLREAMAGITWAQDRPQCGGCVDPQEGGASA